MMTTCGETRPTNAEESRCSHLKFASTSME
jgi:hypothetical protein